MLVPLGLPAPTSSRSNCDSDLREGPELRVADSELIFMYPFEG